MFLYEILKSQTKETSQKKKKLKIDLPYDLLYCSWHFPKGQHAGTPQEHPQGHPREHSQGHPRRDTRAGTPTGTPAGTLAYPARAAPATTALLRIRPSPGGGLPEKFYMEFFSRQEHRLFAGRWTQRRAYYVTQAGVTGLRHCALVKCWCWGPTCRSPCCVAVTLQTEKL